MKAVFASQNRNKLDELRASLPGWEIEPLDADGWPDETAETYWGNADIKAQFGQTVAAPDLWILGEDSGIECDAIGGEPGLHSARWAAGRNQADALLERLDGETNRRSRMVSALVCLSPAGRGAGMEFFCGMGVLEGALATERRGASGFGYDPIFIPDGHTETVAELGEAWKNEHSHRARAAASLLSALAEPGGS